MADAIKPIRLLARDHFPVEHTPLFAQRGTLNGDHRAHDHDFMEIVLFLGGRGRHQTIYGDAQLGAGDVLALRPGVWHWYHDCHRLELFNCLFGVELLRRELGWMLHDPILSALCWPGARSPGGAGMVMLRLKKPGMKRCCAELTALARLGSDEAPSRRAERVARLILFLSELARHFSPPRAKDPAEELHPSVVEAVKRMEDDCARPWTLGELADDLRIAEGYFVRRFKAATGLPPMAYLSRLRAERAAAMLLGTGDAISKIGRIVGWDDPNYFARRFRSHFGISATAYRSKFAKVQKKILPL